MKLVALEHLPKQLSSLVQDIKRGEEVLFTEGDIPVARLVTVFPLNSPRKAGSAKHLDHYISPDFNDIPDGFEEYLP